MKYFLLLSLLLMTGCVTMPQGTLTNRIAVPLACDESFVVSQYGPLGLSSKIDERDHAVIAKVMCGK